MNKFLLIIISAFCISSIGYSQNINGRFSSSLYSFENYNTDSTSTNVVRAYEMLNLNVNYGQFSLKTYTNFETDLANKQSEDPLFKFYNFYLEGRNLFDLLSVKLGRQPVFNSVGGGNFDGLSLDLKQKGYKFNAYAGGNVPMYYKFKTTSFKDDFILGAKLSAELMNNFQVDFNYVKKNFKQLPYTAKRFDEDMNAIDVLIQNKSIKYEYASAQIFYTLPKYFSLDTRYDYDISFSKTSKFEVNGRYDQIDNLGIELYYNYREPNINYNSIFSVFDFGNSQEVEAGLDYKINSFLTAIGKFGIVEYKTDNSKRITLGINSNYGNISYRKNLGFAGELDAISIYTAYPLLEGLLTPSLGLSYTNYKLSAESEKDNLTSLLMGVNIRPYRSLSLDVQGQYMNNKIYKNDFRLFVKLNYWFNTNLNL